jgi:hypothetical protein
MCPWHFRFGTILVAFMATQIWPRKTFSRFLMLFQAPQGTRYALFGLDPLEIAALKSDVMAACLEQSSRAKRPRRGRLDGFK